MTSRTSLRPTFSTAIAERFGKDRPIARGASAHPARFDRADAVTAICGLGISSFARTCDFLDCDHISMILVSIGSTVNRNTAHRSAGVAAHKSPGGGLARVIDSQVQRYERSEERRGGKECVSTCKSRGS